MRQLLAKRVRRRLPALMRLLPFAALAAGVAHFVAASPRFALTELPLDDAWIHQVYARALASGHGFAYNPGSQEAGFTSPLWIVLSAPLHVLTPLGTDVVVGAVKTLGVLLAGWVVWETARLGREWWGEAGGMLAGVGMALAPRLVFSSLSGMETLLTVGLWMAAARALRSRRWRLLGVCMALAPLARPEMVLLWPLAALGWFALRPRTRPVLDLGLARAALVALPMVAWSLFCLGVNGHPLPNTFYVKAHPAFGNPLVLVGVCLYYLGQQGLLHTVAGWLGVAAFVGFGLGRRGREDRWTAAFLVGGALLYALGVVQSRTLDPSGYYWTRWVDPPALVLTSAAAVALAGLVVTLVHGWRRRKGAPRGAARKVQPAFAMAVLALVALQLPTLARSWQDRRMHLVGDARAIALLDVAAARWLAEHTAPDEAIAVNDAGAFRYFSGRKTLDLMALNAAPLALGLRTREELMEAWDVRWLAIFPGWFDDPAGYEMLRSFEPRAGFEIPMEEYTVCACPTQTRVLIYERVVDRNSSRSAP